MQCPDAIRACSALTRFVRNGTFFGGPETVFWRIVVFQKPLKLFHDAMGAVSSILAQLFTS
jgi:hypothetical protein